MLHYKQGHEAQERTLSLLCENFYWNTIYGDATRWLHICERYKITKVPYIQANLTQSYLADNNPLAFVNILPKMTLATTTKKTS